MSQPTSWPGLRQKGWACRGDEDKPRAWEGRQPGRLHSPPPATQVRAEFSASSGPENEGSGHLPRGSLRGSNTV